MQKPAQAPDDSPCPPNPTMFQGFEWHIPADHKHWARLADGIPSLASLGVTSMWIPPATKGANSKSVGYDVYDLYDLGEFHQRGARHTRWGTKEELVQLVNTANKHGIGILFDAVLNHKTGADRTETAVAVNVDPNDRSKEIKKPHEIEAWTKFEFPGRGTTYSPLKWRKEHFTGVDYDQKSRSMAIWKFQDKKWAQDVDDELGNYDFLLCADIDHSHPDVRRDLFYWAEWLGSQLKLGGLRLDAIKHYSASFLRDFVQHIDKTVGRDWFMVGEYWRADAKVLSRYIEYMNNRISLFDVPLVQNFSKISRQQVRPDIRRVFDGSLAAIKPANAVTFVMNHDTQTGQTLEMPIKPYFIPIAYAIILLRANFGIPCVFWADLYGTLGPPRPQLPPHGGFIVPRLMLARKLWAYGTELAYFSDSASCIGFTRSGHPSRSGGAGLAVVVNTAWRFDTKRMCVGRHHAGERWTDLLEQMCGETVIDESGYGTFSVGARGATVWVNKDAKGRENFASFIFHKSYAVAEGQIDSNKMRKAPNTFPRWLQSDVEKGSGKGVALRPRYQ